MTSLKCYASKSHPLTVSRLSLTSNFQNAKSSLDPKTFRRQYKRQGVAMSDFEIEMRRKLAVLREGGYPVDRLLQSAATGEVDPNQVNHTPSTNESAQKNLDAILNSWVSGEIGDNDTLTKLFPLAVRYRYGDIELKELLTPEELADKPLAKNVTDAWFSVVLQAPESIQDRFLEDFEAITEVREIGMTAAEFAAEFGKKRPPPNHSR